MNEWIHIDTTSRLPKIRTGTRPFEYYDADPNVGSKFGPDKPTMFLPVTRVPEPSYNEVLHILIIATTADADGRVWEGRDNGDAWLVDYSFAPQDLNESRAIKLEHLRDDKKARVDAGFTVGQYSFPLTEKFFTLLTTRLIWLREAISVGLIPTTAKITFSDLNGKEVSRTLDVLESQYPEYGLTYTNIHEAEVRARDAIEAATSPEEVDAVDWLF